MHEVVTVQLGTQANYLGTHFWNTQESYFTYGGEEESVVDHDVQFRQGIAPDGSDTYTPRALVYDLKDAFGSLRQISALYEPQEQGDAGLWRGATAIHRSNPINPSPYQLALDSGQEPPALTPSSVRYWSDYNRVFYHPRSLIQIGTQTLGSSLNPFEKYATGEELFDDLDKEHDLLDRDLRLFIEECDQLQALNVVASTSDAWGGFTSRYVERLRDEFEKGAVWVWGIEEGRAESREKTLIQTLNTAQSLYSMIPQASSYVPLTTSPTKLPPYLNLDTTSTWHTSALQATAFESITLPTRLRQRTPVDDFEAILSNEGKRKIQSLSLTLSDPDDLQPAVNGTGTDHRVNGYTNGHHHSSDLDEPEPLDIDMSEGRPLPPATRDRSSARRLHTFSQISLLRGPWPSDSEARELTARDRFGSSPIIQGYNCDLLFPLLSSFPEIYELRAVERKLAVKTALKTSTRISERVRALAQFAGRAAGVEEREALRNGLLEVAEEYVEGWESGSEDEDL